MTEEYLHELQVEQDELDNRCRIIQKRWIELIGVDMFNKFVDTFSHQFASCYFGLKLFDKDLTFKKYWNSSKCQNMFNTIMRMYLKALKIKCLTLDVSDFKFYIKHNVNYIITIEKHYIDEQFIRVLVFDHELCKDKE